MKKQFYTVSTVLALSLLCACSPHSTRREKNQKSYQVSVEHVKKTLYFTGTVQPLNEYTLTTPMEGVVETMQRQFGEEVRAGEVLFTLNSQDFQKQYNEILTEYLKSKDSYLIARNKFSGTEDLWQAGLVAKNNYLSEKSSLNTTHISLIQAQQKLEDLLEKTKDEDLKHLAGLSFAEFDEITAVLKRKHNSIRIIAPSDGTLLYPPINSDDKTTRLSVGSHVKAGQILALIGNLQGIRVEIDIPEVDIDKIKPGMPAIIHSMTFPEKALKGTVLAVNAQASLGNGAALPSFTALVEVPNLKPGLQTWVKVGMSASVELSAIYGNKLLAPIAAVAKQEGQPVVQVLHPNGTVEKRFIQTGDAQMDRVVVESGLKAGETLVYG